MTALVDGVRRRLGRGADLETRVAGLEQAVDSARGRLDDRVVDRAADVVDRAGTRLRLSANHTVVALAGATGSGKSSTFNALAGLELAAVGVRRPTTSHATACIWGQDEPVELLEWLGIPPRHRVAHDSSLDQRQPDKGLAGLVLLDLPDHDSTEVAHHLEVERLVRMTDLMVWVLDPQKYADAAVHERFLRPLAGHREVMLVALNQVDQLSPERRGTVLDDVRRRLDEDGLEGVPLVATSARTGEGIGELRAAIAQRVEAKAATRARLAADVADAARELLAESGDAAPPELREKDKREVVDALADAAGVPVVVDAVHRATTMRSRRATGFPLTSWLSRLRPDPLRRLHLDLGRSGRDLVSAARSSVPQANQVQQAKVDSAVREVTGKVSQGLEPAWSRAVRSASTSRFDDLNDELDRAVTTTDLGTTGVPVWARLVRVVQWTLLAAAVTGALWLGAAAVLDYLRMPALQLPDWRGVPVPTVLLVGGVLAGVLLALLSRALIALGARARARAAERRLRAAVVEVANRLVFAPIGEELAAYRRTREGLRDARG